MKGMLHICNNCNLINFHRIDSEHNKHVVVACAKELQSHGYTVPQVKGNLDFIVIFYNCYNYITRNSKDIQVLFTKATKR